MSTQTYTFEAVLEAHGRGGSFCLVPATITEALGTRAQVRVRGTLNGHEFASNLAAVGGGQHALLVHKATRAALGAAPGSVVQVSFRPDTAERIVEVPTELADALAATPVAGATFEALAYTHRKEYARWIAEAKKPETRTRRVAKAVAMLVAGQKIS